MDWDQIREIGQRAELSAACTFAVFIVAAMIWAVCQPPDRKEAWRRAQLSPDERAEEDRIEKEDLAGF